MNDATIEQVIAFRLAGHGLARRSDRPAFVPAAGACGVQNTPPGSAGMALSARVRDVGGEDVERALEQDRSLLQAFSLRGAPHLFPVPDARVFTRGMLPETEEELRGYMSGAVQALDRLHLSATDLVELTAVTLREVLDGTAMTKEDLGRATGEAMEARLPAGVDADLWRSPSWLAKGQFLGESMARFAFAVMALRGVLCHTERAGRSPLLGLPDQWLDRPVEADGPASEPAASAELVRRYLRCYGPSNPQHLAQWTGVTPEQAQRLWSHVEDELAEVSVEGSPQSVLREDAARLQSPEAPDPVRLLPPYDPYLQARDRATIVPNRAWQKEIWRATGNPGVVLHEGRVVATWRPAKSGRRLDLSFDAPQPLPPGIRGALDEEAERLAAHRGCTLGTLDGLAG